QAGEEPVGSNDTPGGSGSVATMAAASEGPLLATERVKVNPAPASTLAALAALTIRRSAWAVTGVVVLAGVLAGAGAVVGIGPVAAGETLAARGRVPVAPAGTVPTWQLTV